MLEALTDELANRVQYLLYILTDYIHLGQTNPGLLAATAVAILSGINAAAMFLSMAVSGWIADKFGRLKPFVFWASMGFAVPIVLLLIAPSWPAILAAQLINGLSFGLYLAVDQALMTRVLPSVENAARDLGILNIANAGPQVLGPLCCQSDYLCHGRLSLAVHRRSGARRHRRFVCAPSVLCAKTQN